MIHKYNGDGINAQPPISTISVNKFSVVFKDNQKLKSIKFQNALETKQFINWLVLLR